jgi:hypothetical protein
VSDRLAEYDPAVGAVRPAMDESIPQHSPLDCRSVGVTGDPVQLIVPGLLPVLITDVAYTNSLLLGVVIDGVVGPNVDVNVSPLLLAFSSETAKLFM